MSAENYDRFRVETIPRGEVDLALEAAAAEGWNPGLHDADCFWAIDPSGFFMGVLDGRVVGRASAVAYDDHFGFFGLFIVEPELRGRGCGSAITEAALRYNGTRNLGLDGVVAMEAKYAARGFRAVHRSIRHAFTPRRAVEPRAGIVSAAGVPFEALVDYDARHFPARRPGFLARWISQPDATALAFVEGGSIGGFGVIRACRKGRKIGPLFAEDDQVAEALFQALCNAGIGESVYLDVPEPNAAAMALAHRHGMTPEFECIRMYLRGDPGLPLDRIYGVTAFEVG
ncbi:GNAT family N-acetyltransferase [Paludisphaera rhizosphaerae]|uniref:GNAT family N-acetyltransferase n=1 Tax=Paludisphaera rhizosphaerae TaxID=2711216 RepID=UPI0013EAC79F|nr:GNAT family N-acetyltransferase [Paludisphaera rhizosphaerae]